MLRGDFWLLPDGTVTENEGFEHGHYAKRAMLNLDKYDEIPAEAMFYPQDWLKPFSERQVQVFRDRGVPEDRLDWLAQGRDPRKWVILNFDWIRVHAGRHFGVRTWDTPTLRRIQGAHAFWSAQPKADLNDIVLVEEISTNDHFETPLKRMKYAEDAEAVRVTAQGVGRWRNPDKAPAHDHQAVRKQIKAALAQGAEPESLKPLWSGLASQERQALYLLLQFEVNGLGYGNSLSAALCVIAAQIHYNEIVRQEDAAQLSENPLT